MSLCTLTSLANTWATFFVFLPVVQQPLGLWRSDWVVLERIACLFNVVDNNCRTTGATPH